MELGTFYLQKTQQTRSQKLICLRHRSEGSYQGARGWSAERRGRGSGSREAQGSQPLLASHGHPALPRRLKSTGQQLGLQLPTLGRRVFQKPEFPAQWGWNDGKLEASENPSSCYHSSLWCDLGSLSPDKGNEVLVDKEDKSQAGNLHGRERWLRTEVGTGPSPQTSSPHPQ